MCPMTESKPYPTRLLRWAATAASWSLGLVAAAWLALALAWGALHGWIVPRIGEFRPWLETYASQALGVPVRIGAISAQSEHLFPSFELRDVALLDAQGREALTLSRVTATVSPASLLKRGFETLGIEQPALDVRRSADGTVFIAGLDVSHTGSGDGRALDWLFAQSELVVRGGTVRWTDEQRAAPPLVLSGVDLVMRNKGLGHQMRLDASPPAEWGDRFSLSARFRQPLLSTHRGRWQDWDGPAYASLPRVDVSQLRRYADVGVDVEAGVGALRLWADIRHGRVTSGTADVALVGARATLAADLQPLALQSLQGRITLQQAADSMALTTEGLQFTTDDGRAWPGGNLTLRLQDATPRLPAQGELRADRLDLALLAHMATSLPLGPATHRMLATYEPQGLVEQIAARWNGPLANPASYSAQGRITGLEVAAGVPAAPSPKDRAPLGRPGVRGAALDFDVSQAGGKATVRIAQGALDLPGLFEEPVVPMEQLSATVAWQQQGEALAVQASDVRFANADAEGLLQVKWRSSDPAKSGSRARIPGVLDLQGQLSRGDAARVHRYLPLELDAEVRHYVRDAVLAGRTNQVKFRVKGDLFDFPFSQPGQGEFRIAAEVRDATYAYVPPSLQPAKALPWPALERLSGELVFDGNTLQIHRATATLAGTTGFQMAQAEARIADLGHSVVVFKAQGRGPLADMLGVVNRSPLAEITGQALAQATASGLADLQLRLQLPIASLDKSKVQGSITLGGNDVQITPGSPALARARGVVNFSDTGFMVVGGQARMLGGDAKIEGGMADAAKGAVQMRVQGVATAEGLRQATGLGTVAQIARHATGSAAYTAVVGARQGVPEINVVSNLQGVALNLPAPLAKAADTALPLRFDNALLPGTGGPLRDSLALELGAGGSVASVAYVRDISGPAPRVLRGTVSVGLPPGEAVLMPAEGVSANIRVDTVNADAWQALAATLDAAPAAASAPAATGGYLPTTLAVQAKVLTLGGRTLHQLVLSGSHFATTWRANVDAQELNGYMEYRQSIDSSPGRVYARLTRLTLAPSTATEVETLLDEPSETVPALDIVVDALELKGKKLGRVEVEAVNRGGRVGGVGLVDAGVREWRLNKLSISNPDAQLSATGNWVALGGRAGPTTPRRTTLNFQLDIADAGQLLARFGMPGVVRRGKGQMAGQVGWVGSPLALDTATLGGQFNLAVESGQFLKADPGLAKLLGVLNLQALPRRLALDFRDVFSEGFAFDSVRGDVQVELGRATTNNLQMKGVNAAVMMEGSADIARETQDLKVLVVPEINAGTASLVAAVINPAIGLGTFLAQWFLSRPLAEAATQQFHIDGTWADPRITKVPHKMFGAKVEAQAPTKPEPTP
ncbi:YhdP family protein [Rhodoferax sp. WC2427]|uniref:YhdP family protein n=1 Tax=Rhodoferax sp. WC2427 TaxID=3234144 RepID=UPI003465F57D